MAKRGMVDIVILSDGETVESAGSLEFGRMAATSYEAIMDGKERVRDVWVELMPMADVVRAVSGAQNWSAADPVELAAALRALLEAFKDQSPRATAIGCLSEALLDVVRAFETLGWDTLDPVEGAYWTRWHEAVEGGARDGKELRAGAVEWEERVGGVVWDAVNMGTVPVSWRTDEEVSEFFENGEGGAA